MAATAARAGEIEAEVVDLTLRLKESHKREQRRIETYKDLDEALEDVSKRDHELRQEIERLAAFNRAVGRSRPWKLIQFLRRLLGREW